MNAWAFSASVVAGIASTIGAWLAARNAGKNNPTDIPSPRDKVNEIYETLLTVTERDRVRHNDLLADIDRVSRKSDQISEVVVDIQQNLELQLKERDK